MVSSESHVNHNATDMLALKDSKAVLVITENFTDS